MDAVGKGKSGRTVPGPTPAVIANALADIGVHALQNCVDDCRRRKMTMSWGFDAPFSAYWLGDLSWQ